MQLAAAIAADGDQRQALGQILIESLSPQRAQQQVGKAGAGAHQALDRLFFKETRAQLLLRLRQQGAAAVGIAARFRQQPRQAIQQRPVQRRGGAQRSVIEHRGVGHRHLRSQCAARGLKVSTSCPLGVTSTICSHCADSE